jgi:hypothetical protein
LVLPSAPVTAGVMAALSATWWARWLEAKKARERELRWARVSVVVLGALWAGLLEYRLVWETAAVWDWPTG